MNFFPSSTPPLLSSIIGPSDFDEIFRRARSESRVILTTSKNLKLRAACPEAMLITQTHGKLELDLIEIFDRYNIDLEREKFLTVCGKCGGNIITCEGERYREVVQMKQTIIDTRCSEAKERKEARDQDGNEVKTALMNSSPQLDPPLGEGCESRVDRAQGEEEGGGIHWVPKDREIFMCESCCQVRHHLLSELIALFCSLIGGMSKRNLLLLEPWSLLIISTI
jgi:hypothetical protein